MEKMMVALTNSQEAVLAGKLAVYAPDTLNDLVAHLQGNRRLEAVQAADDLFLVDGTPEEDFADVQGQLFAKRALEIAGGRRT